jgi:nucleoside-diphosphate-sugar epimerase
MQAASARTVVILGAGGYLGSSLCHFFHAMSSYSVLALFHREPNHKSFSDYLVADVLKDDWSERISLPPPLVVINCAFDFSDVRKANYRYKYVVLERNIAALFQRGAAHLINISTMSAYPGCRTDYGREKLFVEKLFKRHNGINVRLGLVVSWHRPGSAFLKLISVVRKSKVIPIPWARNAGFYLCDLEAAVLGIFFLVNLKSNKSHTVSFCYREQLSLRDTLNIIQRRCRLHRIKIPFPWQIAYLLLLVKEVLIGKAKVRADSVLDLAYPTRTVFGRAMFARLIEQFRDDLERLYLVDRMKRGSNGFYFLEPYRRVATHQVRPGSLRQIFGLDPIASLSRLTDA